MSTSRSMSALRHRGSAFEGLPHILQPQCGGPEGCGGKPKQAPQLRQMHPAGPMLALFCRYCGEWGPLHVRSSLRKARHLALKPKTMTHCMNNASCNFPKSYARIIILRLLLKGSGDLQALKAGVQGSGFRISRLGFMIYLGRVKRLISSCRSPLGRPDGALSNR